MTVKNPHVRGRAAAGYDSTMLLFVRRLPLEQTHPTLYKQFKCGNFTVCKTRNKFSCIPIDQVHEQLNAQIKGDGSAIGITENDAAL
jgi:hypothetical protein